MSSKKTPKDASEPRTLRGDDTQAVEPGLNQFQSLGLSFPKSSTGTNEQDTLAYLFDLDNDNLFEVRVHKCRIDVPVSDAMWAFTSGIFNRIGSEYARRG